MNLLTSSRMRAFRDCPRLHRYLYVEGWRPVRDSEALRFGTLFHLGLDAHVVGEMTTPPVGAGDLLICSAGPGDFASMAALTKIAKGAGAKIAIVTAQPASNLAKSADHVLHIPAQTMADDRGAKTSVLPMGSLFELSQMLVFELLVLRLRDIKGETAASMRKRHTNLE